jgi:uncharacterized protein (UPF0332 family)
MTRDEAEKTVSQQWLQLATEALASASSELAAGRFRFAVNRAYYACFYAASALFLLRGRRFAKHSGLRSALHRDLIRSELLNARWGQAYDVLFEARHRADYAVAVEFETEDTALLVEDAEGFVEEIRRLVTSMQESAKGPLS